MGKGNAMSDSFLRSDIVRKETSKSVDSVVSERALPLSSLCFGLIFVVCGLCFVVCVKCKV